MSKGDEINLINFDSKTFPINKISADFRYRFFTNTEQEVLANDEMLNKLDENIQKYPDISPRDIKVNIFAKEAFPLQPINFLNNARPTKNNQTLLTVSDLRPLHSLFVSQKEKIDKSFDLTTLVVESDAYNSKLDWYKQNIFSFDKETRQQIINLSNESQQWQDLLLKDKETSFEKNRNDTDPDLILRNNVIYDILKAKNWHIFTNNPTTLELEKSLSLQHKYFEDIEEDGIQIPHLWYPNLFDNEAEILTCTEEYLEPAFVGYSISKYDFLLNKLEETFEVYSNSFVDNKILYGKTYLYEVRPIYAVTSNIDNTNQVICFIADDSSELKVECIETTNPPPPSNISFDLKSKKLQIKWDYRQNTYAMPDEPRDEATYYIITDDVKGAQIFYRNSLEEPYMLLKHINFNKTKTESLKIRTSEVISDELIVNYENGTDPTPKSFITSIRANQDYYFALCSVDAHGNTSDYSVQYYVRRNNVTGELHVKTISNEGAWKQYPNMLLNKQIVKPAFQASNFNKIEIYLNPDTANTTPDIDPDNGDELVIHLIELNSGKQKQIKFDLNPNQN